MNSRHLLRAARTLVTPKSVVSRTVRPMSGGHYGEEVKPVTYNDLPVPQGSWQADYDVKQRKYNLQLAAGLSFFIFTVYYVTQSGIVFFNYQLPPLPEQEKDE